MTQLGARPGHTSPGPQSWGIVHKDGPGVNQFQFLSHIQLIFGADIREWSENEGRTNCHSIGCFPTPPPPIYPPSPPLPSVPLVTSQTRLAAGSWRFQGNCLWNLGTAHSKRAGWGYHCWKFFSAVKCSLPIWQTLWLFLYAFWIIVG